MGKENTCCFTGHRDILADRLPVVSTKLRTEILQAISDGYTHFICGFASGASLIFAALVAEFKKGCPLVLEAAIPYRMNMLCFIQFIGIRLGQVETSSGGSPISLFSTPTADYLLSR